MSRCRNQRGRRKRKRKKGDGIEWRSSALSTSTLPRHSPPSLSPLLPLFTPLPPHHHHTHTHAHTQTDRDSLKLTQEEYDRPPLAAILQVAAACLLCAWASVRAAGPLRELAPAANQATLAGAPFRGTAWMTLGHRGMAMPLSVAVMKPEGGRSF